MTIRAATQEDIPKLIDLYKEFFPTHNIFQRSTEDITNYLSEGIEIDELLVYDDGEITAAMFIVLTDRSEDQKHTRWKFRHVAYTKEKTAKELITEVEERIKQTSNTAKIELTIAESEKALDFFKKIGYQEEGALKNHYRWGETCFILSKSFS